MAVAHHPPGDGVRISTAMERVAVYRIRCPLVGVGFADVQQELVLLGSRSPPFPH